MLVLRLRQGSSSMGHDDVSTLDVHGPCMNRPASQLVTYISRSKLLMWALLCPQTCRQGKVLRLPLAAAPTTNLSPCVYYCRRYRDSLILPTISTIRRHQIIGYNRAPSPESIEPILTTQSSSNVLYMISHVPRRPPFIIVHQRPTTDYTRNEEGQEGWTVWKEKQ